ncbi:MAG: hypothetical protein ACJ74H_06990 [Thermoanaerobaculia bacterium]
MSRSSDIGCLFAWGLPFAAVSIYTGSAAVRLHAIHASPRLVFIYGCVAAAFGISGFGSMAAALLRSRRPTSIDNPRRISDQSRRGTVIFWGFALLWNAIAAPVAVFVPDAIRRGHHIAWLGFLFPIAGALLLIAAIRLTLRALRFPESTLVLDTMPAPIGGRLRGHVEVAHPLTAVTRVIIRLTALSRRRSGRDTDDTIVCDEKRELQLAQLRRTDDGTIIPVEINIPESAPPSQTSDAEVQIYWRLTVDAEVPGVDYSATFDVPVARDAFAIHSPAKL